MAIGIIDVLEVTVNERERFVRSYFEGGKNKKYEDFLRELDLERRAAS